MECVYHAVPTDMVGTVLVPLNALAGVSPSAFERQRSKYARREAVLDAQITPGGLLFNDTVHCAPLHRHHLYRLRARMDLLPQARTDGAKPLWTPGRFFEIPLERIRDTSTYWYRWQTPWINGYPGEDVPLAPPLEEFEPFDFTRYKELPEVPYAHTAFLERSKTEGKPALMFVHVPHVLVAGPIETNRTPSDQVGRPTARRVTRTTAPVWRHSEPLAQSTLWNWALRGVVNAVSDYRKDRHRDHREIKQRQNRCADGNSDPCAALLDGTTAIRPNT